MINEKSITRLAERDEALKMGFELILISNPNFPNEYRERIKIGNYFIGANSTNSFISGSAFGKDFIANFETTPWFDIQTPKMRQMYLAEIDAYLHEKGRNLCKRYNDGDIYFNYGVITEFLSSEYKYLGTLNLDNTFEPLPLIDVINA